MIKYSILIPIYNSEIYLEMCLESVIGQIISVLNEVNKIELILCDDGSTDRSLDICNVYKEKYGFISVIEQSNHGQLYTREKLLSNSSGEYVIFLDSDDVWHPNLLSVVDKIVSQFKYDMIIFNYYHIDMMSNVVGSNVPLFNSPTKFDDKNKSELIERVLIDGNNNNIWNKVVKRSILSKKEFGQYKHIRMGEDLLQLFGWLVDATNILYIDKELYGYRKNDLGISRSYKNYYVSNFLEVRRCIYNSCKEKKILSKNGKSEFLAAYLQNLKVRLLTYAPLIKEKKSLKNIYEEIKEDKLYQEAINNRSRIDMFYAIAMKNYIFLIGYCFVYKSLMRIKKD